MRTMEDLKKEMERNERKAKRAIARKEFWNWVKANPEVALTLAVSAIGLGTAVVRGVSKQVNLHKAEQVKNGYLYDPSLGHYWRVKPNLTDKQWLTIDRRRANGERYGDILKDMNVLK